MERHGIARMRLVRTQRVVVCAPFSFSFFFFIFFLFSLFFLLLFPLPLPLLLSLLPIPLTDSNRSPRGAPVLPPVLRCQSENSSFCLLAPSSPPHLPDSTSHRFATLSSLLVSSRFAFGFFGLSLPPLLPLLNNCPPRGEDGTRLLRDLGHPRRDREMHLDARIPSSTKKALSDRGTLSPLSLIDTGESSDGFDSSSLDNLIM